MYLKNGFENSASQILAFLFFLLHLCFMKKRQEFRDGTHRRVYLAFHALFHGFGVMEKGPWKKAI